MQPVNSHHATDWSREGPRTLIVKDGAVWMWPGIPLAMEQDGIVQPLPRQWVRSWVTALHGFEAQDAPLEPALIRASVYLTAGDDDKAQQTLDLVKIERLSPEGVAVMRAVAEELGIAPLEMAVGTRSLPWGIGNLGPQLAMFRHFGRAAAEFEKGDNPDEPRWPKGAPDSQGGEYAPADGGAGSTEPEAETRGIGDNGGPPLDPPEPPSIGHNGGPPLDDMPDIPEEEPETPKLINALLKNLGAWLVKRGVVALIPGVGEAAAIVQLGVWLYQYLPYLDAYIQPPQSLQDLQDAANDPQPGYQIHHIVEQTPARKEGYSNDDIEAPENRVRISTLKHWQISNWYSTPSPEFNGLSPRNYLRGKDWAEKVRIGRKALIDFGVLKP
jgi:hypothetical protein